MHSQHLMKKPPPQSPTLPLSVLVPVIRHVVVCVVRFDLHDFLGTGRIIARFGDFYGLIAIHSANGWFLVIAEGLHKRLKRLHQGRREGSNIERGRPLTANDHAIAVHEVTHELPGLADEFDASGTPASITRAIEDTLDLAMPQSHRRYEGVFQLFVQDARYFTVDMPHLIAGEIAQQVEQVDPGAQNHPTTSAGKIVQPVVLGRLQTLAHTDGVDGPDLVEMLLQRLHHRVESQRVGHHQQAARTARGLHDIDRLTGIAGHGLFDQHGLTSRDRGGTDALVQARWGHHRDSLDLGIAEQIEILTVVVHIMFTGEGPTAQWVLSAHGIELSTLHVTHEMLGIAHAVPAHANESKPDGSHSNLLDRHVSHAMRPLPHHHSTVDVDGLAGNILRNGWIISMTLWYQAAWEGSKAPSLRPSRCPLVVHLAAPLKRDGTMATINVHQAKDGSKTYRVRVRQKGQPVQTASFSTLKDAKRWATMIEGDLIAGRHFPASKPKHTLVELLDRYVQDIMPRKTPETQRSHKAVVVFWQERLGHKPLTDITKADISALRDKIQKTSAPATVQKYLTILGLDHGVGHL